MRTIWGMIRGIHFGTNGGFDTLWAILDAFVLSMLVDLRTEGYKSSQGEFHVRCPRCEAHQELQEILR